MTIRVFSPIVPDQQIVDPVEYEGNLLTLLRAQEGGYTLEEKREDFHVTVNGRTIPFKLYGDTHLERDDDVRIYIAPKGGIVKAIGSLLGGIFKVVFGLFGLNQSSGSGSRYRGTATGQNIEAAAIRSNTPRMGATVPEQFGRFRRYCDSLSEQRRFYVNKRNQYVDVLLHVTIGEIANVQARLGNTPIDDLPDCQYWIHPPGANLAGHVPAQLWHSSPAVGGTAGGTAGIMLSADIETTVNTDPESYTFDGNTITRSSGVWPSGWGPGTVIRVFLPLTYTVTRSGSAPFYGPNVFTGNFKHLMPLSNGDPITVSGAGLEGTYLAQNVSLNGQGEGSIQLLVPGTPPTETSPGTDPEPVNNIVPGAYTITFRKQDYILSVAAENYITTTTNSFPSINSAATIRYVSGPVYGPYTAPIIVSPTGQKNTEVEVDLFLPQGLRYTKDDGSPTNTSVTVDIEFSDADGVVPTTVLRRVYTDATPDQLGFTEKFTYSAPAKCRVRVRRIGAVSADPRRVDEVHWYGLRCRMPDRNSYPWTTMTVRLKAGNQLGTQSENQVNVVGTRILPELEADGSLSAPRPTRSIAAAAIRVAQAAGFNLSDWHDEIIHLNNTYWTPRNETFDYILDETTVKGALDSILQAGMTELTTEHGYLKPVRDVPRTVFDQGFSPQNIIGEVVETTRQHREDDNDGYEVEYTDSETWEKMTIKCMPPGSLGVRLRKIKLDGVVQKTIAWRIGMRRSMADLHRRTGYSLRTEAAGLNAYYLGYISVINTLRNWGQSFNLVRVEQSGSKALLFVSEKLVFDDISPPYVAAVTDFKGRVIGPFAANVIDEGCIEISGVSESLPVPTLDKQLPAVYFGQENKMSYPALVQVVTPEQGMYAKVEAINYDDRVYAYDNAFPTE